MRKEELCLTASFSVNRSLSLSLSLSLMSPLRSLLIHGQYFSETPIDVIGACWSIIMEKRLDQSSTGTLMPIDLLTILSQLI